MKTACKRLGSIILLAILNEEEKIKMKNNGRIPSRYGKGAKCWPHSETGRMTAGLVGGVEAPKLATPPLIIFNGEFQQIGKEEKGGGNGSRAKRERERERDQLLAAGSHGRWKWKTVNNQNL